jgi:polysaccharide biosynthesis protein VpsJ
MSSTQNEVRDALSKLDRWVQEHDWKGYDTFDGLSSPLAPILTLGHPFLKQVWQQGVRRFPINLRPALLIKPGMSSKGMAFFAQGYLKLYETEGRPEHLEKMRFCLQWLIENPSKQFKNYSWGNHFDYQSRGGNIPKGAPTIVWTGLIGHAFMDAFESLREQKYLDVAKSACNFIVDELGWMDFGDAVCLRYYPNATNDIHNSSMIGASLLARVNSSIPNPRYMELAEKAIYFTVRDQMPNGAWNYGVAPKWHWVDSFHTGYVLESLECYIRHSGAEQYAKSLELGYEFFVNTFFGEDGTPRYYDYKTPPLDIQCASQGIQTLVKLRSLHPSSLEIAKKVAHWTIRNMQDPSGYFYYRKYPLITNKTPTLHWGQATMFAALALLDNVIRGATTGPARSSASVVAA